MAKNSKLHKAKFIKNDEFYTQLLDIEKELEHYKKHFKDAVVLCNCNDFEWSSFWKYFHLNFESLGLKKLISTQYHETESTHKIVYKGGKDSDITAGEITPLKGNGDFRSPECIELLKEATIVCTNPPFSLFREYIAQLIEYNKKFLIIGNINAIGYKEIFPLIKSGNIWLGCTTRLKSFYVPDDYEGKCYIENGVKIAKLGNTKWFTNLDINKRHKPIDLIKKYTPEEYPKFDNYDAINVNRTSDIPCDYYGVMGVPISFMDKYCSEQFEIVGLAPERSPELILKTFQYLKAIQHKKDGTTTGGNKVNDGPTILHTTIPKKYPYYTCENREGYLEVLYSRILIKRKLNKNECETTEHKSNFVA